MTFRQKARTFSLKQEICRWRPLRTHWMPPLIGGRDQDLIQLQRRHLQGLGRKRGWYRLCILGKSPWWIFKQQIRYRRVHLNNRCLERCKVYGRIVLIHGILMVTFIYKDRKRSNITSRVLKVYVSPQNTTLTLVRWKLINYSSRHSSRISSTLSIS